jgi:anti-sigma regulatory factor (Ser/Thr protein kinase)
MVSAASSAGAAQPGARLYVPHERSGVRLARHAVADQLMAAGVSGAVRDDAVLVLSELVSNAVRHAAPLPSGEITVTWRLQGDVLHVEATDGGATTRPQATEAASSSLGGRGLAIVRVLSRHWGFTEGDGSVTVWAELPTTRDPAGGN